jgi:hypothetical protein
MAYTVNKAQTTNNDRRTGSHIYPGTFLAEVMHNQDPQKAGRLWVYISEFGYDKKDPASWVVVSYASPFYGISPHTAPVPPSTSSSGTAMGGFAGGPSEVAQRQQQEQEQPVTTYGFWAIPPDVGVKVLCTFVEGNSTYGYWYAIVPTISHSMIPAMGAPDGKSPVMDINPLSPKIPTTEDLDSLERQPYQPLVQQFTTQGIAEDPLRGPITSSSFRESPSRVFGISSQVTPESPGHTFVMDDGDAQGKNKLIRLRTSGGNQISMHDDTGMIYLINAQGTGWIEISPSGQIDVFGAEGINLATPKSINLHATENVNIHAGNCVKIVGMKGTKVMGGEELQLHGKKTMIEGVDSLHVHSCGEMMYTSYGDIHMKAFNYFCLKGKCFYWNSCTAKEAEQVPPEKPQDVSGYQTTVTRAPSKEPYKEHDNGQSQGGGSASAGGTGASGGGGSATDAGGMFGGITGGGPAALNNPVTMSNFANPKTTTQLAGGTLAGAGGLTGLAAMSDPSSPFRATASAGITPTNSVSSYGMNFNGGKPTSVAIAPSATIASPSAARNTTMQGAVRTSSGTSVSSTYTAATTVSGGPGAPLYTKPSTITINTSTTSQVGPNPSTTSTTTQNIDTSTAAANPYLGRGGQQPVGADSALANVETPGQQPTGVFGSQNPADQTLTGNTPAQEASNALGQMGGMSPSSDLPAAPGGGGTGCFAQGDNCERPADQTGGSGAPGGNAQPGQKNFTPPDELKNDPEFQKKLAEMKAKYPGLTDQQIYNVIGGESGFNFAAVNSQSGATGAFQFIPSTAAGLGYSTAQIQAMTPAQQLGVYDQYLASNGYKGGALGIMQAAPKYAGASGNTIVYQRGSAAWNQNPGWRGSDGNITVDSINRYYGY